jgi:hypothetical protein
MNVLGRCLAFLFTRSNCGHAPNSSPLSHLFDVVFIIMSEHRNVVVEENYRGW